MVGLLSENLVLVYQVRDDLLADLSVELSQHEVACGLSEHTVLHEVSQPDLLIVQHLGLASLLPGLRLLITQELGQLIFDAKE